MSKRRQKYETETDRKNERDAADMIEKAWNCRAIKMGGEFAPVDFILVGKKTGKIYAMMEVKCRLGNTHTRFDTIFISQSKVDNLVRISGNHEVPGFLVWRMSDGLFYIKAGEGVDPDFSEMGGRTDRGDRQDIEMMNHYKNTRMVGVKGYDRSRPDTSELVTCQGGPPMPEVPGMDWEEVNRKLDKTG